MLLGLSVVSCKDNNVEPVPDPPAPVAIAFQAGFGGYVTKATDDSFEAGDSLALWAEGGVTASCIPLVCSGVSFDTPAPLFWSDLNASSATFTAMYPFAASRAGSVFSVSTDQSSHAAYTASDLMLGSVVAENGTKVVSLPMNHQLCQIAVCVKNELDDPVSEVLLNGVLCSVGFSRTGIAAASGEPASVRTAAASLNGSPAWVAVLPPQEFDFSVEVITASGAHFKYATGPFAVDESGVQIRFELVLNALSLSCTPQPYVTGWTLPLVQDSSSIKSLSLGSFASLPDDDREMYRLSGKITSVEGSSFSLTDAVDTVKVGSLLSPSCVPDVQFSAKGLGDGDFLRVYGIRGFADGAAFLPSAVYVTHADGLAVSADSGESFVWEGVADLADWSSELCIPASSFSSLAAGSALCIHFGAVFNNFWTVSVYSGAMDSISPGTSVSGTADTSVLEIAVTDVIATAMKSSGLVVRGTAVVGAVGIK